MDTIDTTPVTTDVVIDSNGEVVNPDTTFAKEVTKTLATSLAITAGTVGTMIVAGFAYEKFRQFTARRSEKNATVGDTIEGEIDETIETVKDKIKN